MSSEKQSEDSTGAPEVRIREATLADQDAISALFEPERGRGVADAQGGRDVHDLASHYLNDDEGSSFWVAEHPEAGLVGMIGVWSARDHHGQVRRLLVHPEHRQRGIGTRLVEAALRFCADRGYVKVVLDTEVDQSAAISLFKRCGFQHTRTRRKDEREVLDFYMDLYSARSESEES